MAKESKGKLKGILNIFFEDEQKPVEQKVEAAKQDVVQSQVAPQPITQQSAVTGTVNDDIKADLIKALEDNNVDGYDYFEFRGALANMAKVIPIEAERFRAAHAAVSTMVSVDRLIETANYYLGIVQKKELEFNGIVDSLIANKVTGNEEKAKTVDADIQAKQTQIDEINKQIATLQEQRKALLETAIAEKAKIEKVKMDFSTTSSEVIRQIKSDIDKMKTYLAVKEEGK